MQLAANGQHISTVELQTQKGGQRLVIKLKDVLVSSAQQGNGDVETYTFTFGDLEFDTGEKDKK